MSEKKPERVYLELVLLFGVAIIAYYVLQYYQLVSSNWLGWLFGASMWLIFMKYGGIQMLRLYGFLKEKPLPDDYKLPEPKETYFSTETKPFSLWKTLLFWVFAIWGFPWVVIGILYYFPQSIFNGQAFMETEAASIMLNGYIIVVIVAIYLGGYNSIKRFFGR